jgi:hypothetical protein
MNIYNFVREDEYALISFSFDLIQEVERKIHSQTFFYKEQIDKFLEKKVNLFLSTISVKKSLKNVYRQQILMNVYFKLKNLINKNIHFSLSAH